MKTNEEKAEDPISTVEYSRLVGGKVCNQALTALHKLYKKRHGGVMSAGASSGGVMSAGASSGGAHYASSGGKKRAHKML